MKVGEPYHYEEWLDYWLKQPLAEVVKEVQAISWHDSHLVNRQKAAVKALSRRTLEFL